MSIYGSKHVEECNIIWINNNLCIKLVINTKLMEYKTGFTSEYICCSYKLKYFACYYKEDKPMGAWKLLVIEAFLFQSRPTLPRQDKIHGPLVH
jgi:hypothetical protein